MKKHEILNKILKILSNYLKINIIFGNNYEKDRMLLRGILNQCLNLKGIKEDFYILQDKLLRLELNEKTIISKKNLKFKNNIALYFGDITLIKSDAIVNAANDEYLGCFIPCHNSIDNIIQTYGGFQIRDELLTLKSLPDYERQFVKVTKGYNLPSKYIFHVAGPHIVDKITENDKNHLARCYTECLNKAKEMNLKSIALCCISTGVYNFDNALACDIAVDTVGGPTVRNWPLGTGYTSGTEKR